VTSAPPPPPPRFKPPSFSPPTPPSGGGFGPPPGAAPPDAKTPKRRGPLFWIGVGCAGCVVAPLLLFGLFFGVVGGGVFYFTREPVRVVQAQLQEIREGRLDAAYARLGGAYQASLTREAFAQMLEKHPALKDNADASFWNRSFDNGQMRLSGTLTARSGAKGKVSYELHRENGEWKIAAIRFPDE
jgi:uncharacterized protein DUF4864